jgi:hypothetical protein
LAAAHSGGVAFSIHLGGIVAVGQRKANIETRRQVPMSILLCCETNIGNPGPKATLRKHFRPCYTCTLGRRGPFNDEAAGGVRRILLKTLLRASVSLWFKSQSEEALRVSGPLIFVFNHRHTEAQNSI